MTDLQKLIDAVQVTSGEPTKSDLDNRIERIRNSVHGVGTRLRRFLSHFGLSTCGECAKLQIVMDQQGVSWCDKYFDELIEQLLENTSKQDVTWNRYLVKMAATFSWLTGKKEDAVAESALRYGLRKAIDDTVEEMQLVEMRIEIEKDRLKKKHQDDE